MRTFTRGVIVASILAGAQPAIFGGDFLASGASARSAATAGIYAPDATDVSDAMAMNPAGLTRLGGPVLNLSTEAGFAYGRFRSASGASGSLDAAGAVPFAAFGTTLGSSRWTRRLSLGVALLPELLSAAKWHYVDPPGGVGSVSYGDLRSNSEITAIRTALGIGVYLGARVQIGFTAGATSNSNTLQTAYVFQNYAPLAGLKTLLDLHTNGVGFNSSAGALVRMNRRIQVGVAYKSRTEIRSTGSATGNASAQFAAIGLGAARPDFRYTAEVDNVLPQSVIAGMNWQINSRLRLLAQGDWVNWNRAFQHLPVILTQGNNADINGLLGSNGLRDSIPLDWRDQAVVRVGVERSWWEHAVLRAGYAHAKSPVPSSTLSPLTAAITTHSLSAGAGYAFGRWRLDGAYVLDPSATQSSETSALRSGEFSHSTVRVGTQGVTLTSSWRL